MPLKESLMAGAGRLLRASFPGGRLGRLCDRTGRSPKFQILVYHRVLPEKDPFSIGVVTEREMRGQMSVLRECFRVVSLERLAGELADGGPEPGTVCVTFDDGYMDNHRHALPILEEFSIPATVFLATDFIGTGRVPWYDRVLQAARHSRASRLALEGTDMPAQDLPASPRERADAAHRITRWLKRFAPEERDALIGRILAGLGGEAPAVGNLMLGWEQVREMAARGVAFGAHTMSHPILTRVSPAAAEAEIGGSKRIIEERLGSRISLFAYPNGQLGDWDEALMGMLRRLGFACAVTTVEGVNTPARDRMELFRRQPWESNPHSFLFRMCAERLAA